jgi:hypothetical protein
MVEIGVFRKVYILGNYQKTIQKIINLHVSNKNQ